MTDPFPKASFLNIPSIPSIPNALVTLQMINTVNQLPIQSALSPNEDSLGVSLLPTHNHSSKKKKIGCTCKKTQCLKLYCQCFAQGKKCTEDCVCIDCKNTDSCQEHITKAKRQIREPGIKSSILAHIRCNCKKTQCLKRYCECFNAGLACT